MVPKILAGQSIERAWIGISTAEGASGTGATVGAVTDQSPAARAGLQEGDVLTQVDGATVTGPDAVTAAIADRKPGDRISVSITRGGQARTVELTLGTRPASAPSRTTTPGVAP